MSVSMTSASFSDSVNESGKRRSLERNRHYLALLNPKEGGVIRTPNGIEVIAKVDTSFGQVVAFSGRCYGHLEIRKVG